MTIAELATLGKTALAPVRRFIDRIPPGILTFGIVLLASSASFGLGILEDRNEAPARISIEQLATTTPNFLVESQKAAAPPASLPVDLPAGGEYVASKSGAKYYLPWCGGAKLIKEENKIWFASKEDAEAQGYEPAANCKGL